MMLLLSLLVDQITFLSNPHEWILILACILAIALAFVVFVGGYLKYCKKYTYQELVDGVINWPVLCILLFLLIVELVLYYAFHVNGFVTVLIIPTIVGVMTSFLSPVVQLRKNNEKIKKIANEVANDVVKMFKTDYANPIKLYPESSVPETELQTDLENSMRITENYHYSGIEMTVASKCIVSILKDIQNIIEMVFFIPMPENTRLDKEDLICMKNSVDDIKKAVLNATYNCKVSGTFILLKYIPPFHIHLTDNNCWFALVEKNEGGKKYPTTYLYQKPETRNTTSMYITLDNMVKTLKDNTINEWRDEEKELREKGEEKRILKYKYSFTIEANSAKSSKKKKRKNQMKEVDELIGRLVRNIKQ